MLSDARNVLLDCRSFGAVFGFASVLGPLLGGAFTGEFVLVSFFLSEADTSREKIMYLGVGEYRAVLMTHAWITYHFPFPRRCFYINLVSVPFDTCSILLHLRILESPLTDLCTPPV
jgi:hypothetical protein